MDLDHNAVNDPEAMEVSKTSDIRETVVQVLANERHLDSLLAIGEGTSLNVERRILGGKIGIDAVQVRLDGGACSLGVAKSSEDS